LSNNKVKLDIEELDYNLVIRNSRDFESFKNLIKNPEIEINEQKVPVIVKLVKTGNC